MFFTAITLSLNKYFSWQGDRGHDGESGKQGEAVSTVNIERKLLVILLL